MSEIEQKLVAWAEIQPGKPFIIEAESGRQLTYSQTLASVQAARKMLGDTPKKVFLSLSNGLENAVLWLAALTGGHLLMPLPPTVSEAECTRAKHMFQPDVLVVEQAEDAQKFSAPAALVITQHDCAAFMQKQVPSTELAGAKEGRVCFMTSGTTGHPKGVILTTSQIAWTADHIRTSHRLTSSDRGLTVLPFSHVNAPVVSLCSSLLAGSTVVIARRFSRSRFWSWIEAYDITWASIVPTIVAMLLSTERPAFLPGTLRFVRTASAPLPVAHMQSFEAKFGVPVIETYGLSEAASQVAANPVPPGRHKAGSVGLPTGVCMRICRPRMDTIDDELHDVVPGTPGEICIKGPSVIHAYVGGQGQEAFKDGWFRTGDLGYQDSDGYLYITGRVRDVIIRGGENIAPREVEETLLRHPAVQEVAVVGLPDPIYGEQVAAFVVAHAGWSEAEVVESLREFATQNLSSYKVPAEIVVVDALPKNGTGKVERRLLREFNFQKVAVGGR
ncbi:MAG TPA: AMP-binding protein [Ktedonobacteraceae bacterium]|jgi:acyl-CoA synthetase (AMP-forming)/AMP-acid ligase II|nr:AMP-binding protein [Ktedonobacteraceae bacterium]